MWNVKVIKCVTTKRYNIKTILLPWHSEAMKKKTKTYAKAFIYEYVTNK